MGRPAQCRSSSRSRTGASPASPRGSRASRRRGGSARSRDRSGRMRERPRPCRGRPGRVSPAHRRDGGHGRAGRGPAPLHELAEGLAPGFIGQADVALGAAVEHHRAVAMGRDRERPGQRGLPDPGLAADQRQAPLALEGAAPRRRQALLFLGPADEHARGQGPDQRGQRRAPGVGGSGSQTTLAAATGSGNPFRTSCPTGSRVGPPADCTSSRTASVTSTWPPAARSQRRLASIGGRPYQSPSTSSASPTAMPTRIASGVSLRRLRSSTPCCIATAHATAAEALGNAAITPSPAT